MRCPSCGATNPDGARWCGQCLHRFGQEPAPAGPAPAAGAPSPAARPAADSAGVSSGAFRRQGDDLEWACPSCGQFNAMDLLHCGVCGTAFVEQFRADEPAEPQNWSQAFAMSAVAPGAGHLAVGRYGSGAARMLLFLTWAMGAVVLGAGGGSRAVLAVVPLILGAATIYGLTLVDIRRLEHGQDELLVGRRLLWLVLGVLGLLGVGLVSSLVSVAT